MPQMTRLVHAWPVDIVHLHTAVVPEGMVEPSCCCLLGRGDVAAGRPLCAVVCVTSTELHNEITRDLHHNAPARPQKQKQIRAHRRTDRFHLELSFLYNYSPIESRSCRRPSSGALRTDTARKNALQIARCSNESSTPLQRNRRTETLKSNKTALSSLPQPSRP
jgi:hypothetical protein